MIDTSTQTALTNYDTGLLLVLVMLMLIVMSILLSRRATAQKKAAKLEEELLHTKHELRRAQRTAATIRPVIQKAPAPKLLSPDTVCHKPLQDVRTAISQSQQLFKHGTATPEIVASTLAKADNAAYTLERAIHNVSLSNRLVQRSPKLQSGDIKPLVEKLFTTHHQRAESAGLSLNIDITPRATTAFTDTTYLYEILEELVYNAITYTEKGTVTVTVESSRAELTVHVKDTGIGIRKSEQSRLFDKGFRSADHRVQALPGTGLGLYVAAELARAINATLLCTSRLHHGSTFSVTIPRQSNR